jgi:IS30 family transposase
MERRTYGQLSLTERIEIYRLHADGKSLRIIAKALMRSPSTISRELKRNGSDGYAPERAQSRYVRRHARGRRHKLERQPELRKLVFDLLAMERSPEQIVGRLTLEHGKSPISHESIYRYIYWHSYHFRHEKLHKLLPRQRKSRRSRSGSKPHERTEIPSRTPLCKRPKGALNRSRYGHWEADLMQFSAQGTSVLVLYDRKSRYICAAPQATKKAQEVMAGLHTLFENLPDDKRKTVTFDNGQEFRNHQELQRFKGIKTFFCEPHKPWQKGGIENTIGRLRRALPRKTSPQDINKEMLDAITDRFNNTPRKCLGFKTPAEAFFKQRVALQT